MITCYFGVPGVGKNTILTKLARKAKRRRLYFRGLIGPKRYDHIYTSFYCEGCEMIDFNDLEKYKTYNSLIMFDEMSLDADNRDFKTFSKGKRDFIVLHRHLGNDIIYATQNYAKVDSKIRDLTDELWYLSKSVVPILREFTVARRIFRTIAINEFTGDLILGYRFCNFLERFFVSNLKIVFRRFYYKYFNTHDEGSLATRTEYNSIEWKVEQVSRKQKDSFLLLCLNKLDKIKTQPFRVSFREERVSQTKHPFPGTETNQAFKEEFLEKEE